MPDRAAPYITVIVPVYNVAKHVAACLTSLQKQTFRDFEVLVIDDGSTDASAEVARATVAGDSRFVFRSQPNRGLSAARNAGLAHVRGQWVGFVDSDDRVTPNYLARLVAAQKESGADWVSCGIQFCHEGQAPVLHSGLHGQTRDEMAAAAEAGGQHWQEMVDWCAVVAVFPSVWNKIYRADLLAGLRFDEGLNYEDHAFLWRYASRAGPLLRLAAPLYLSTQGRGGQITADGSERVFEQFDVLDILENISEQTSLNGSEDSRRMALAQIATRLTFERALAITDRPRRAQFVARAQAWLAARALQADATLGVPAAWLEVLAGEVPVTVVVPSNGDLEALQSTLDSLMDSTLAEIEVLVVVDSVICPAGSEMRIALFAAVAAYPGVSVLDGGAGPVSARNRGMQAALGGAIVFLDAGDWVLRPCLMHWHNRLRATGAVVGFGRLRMGGEDTPHVGVHDRTAIAEAHLTEDESFVPTPQEWMTIHGHPSAKIFDRSFLAVQEIGFPAGPLSSTHMLLRALGAAQSAVYLAQFPVQISTRPACRSQWRAAVPPQHLRAALAAMQKDDALSELPPGWEARLWARLVWEKINYADFASQKAAQSFAQEVTKISSSVPGLEAGVVLDPFVGGRVQQLIGLSGAKPTA